jgi:phage tail tape-measure protein
MQKSLIAAFSALTLMGASTVAFATDTGAAAGAATGAAAGAAVGGPVGAAVGAGVGGVSGHAATGPNRRGAVIEHRDVRGTGSTGCATKTKQKTNELGETKTKQKTVC